MIETEILDKLYLEIAQFSHARNYRELAAVSMLTQAGEKLTKGVNLLDVLRLIERTIELLEPPNPLS